MSESPRNITVDESTVILGIETSCDETAAAVVMGGNDILSNIVSSQIDIHARFGGVVPEVASRAHLEALIPVVDEAITSAGIEPSRIDAVAATVGPGLIGALLVGVSAAKALSLSWNRPFIGVNHMEAHLYAGLLDDPTLEFPLVVLLVSGGHTMIVEMRGHGDYSVLGHTIDDAAGEAYDKVARYLNLGYPGGPAIEQTAKIGDSGRIALPRPMKGKPNCDFSFSGLKTAVRQMLPAPLTAQDAADMAASFQMAVADAVADRCKRASRIFFEAHPEGLHLVVAGGVAANSALRSRLEKLAKEVGLELIAPPLKYCTDNAAMIAWAGIERLRLDQRDGMDFAPRPRWPLDPSAPKARFAGVKA